MRLYRGSGPSGAHPTSRHTAAPALGQQLPAERYVPEKGNLDEEDLSSRQYSLSKISRDSEMRYTKRYGGRGAFVLIALDNQAIADLRKR